METYRLAVGRAHRVKPANIVGALINEAGLDGQLIGHIDIQEDYSLVDLPEGMPRQIFRDLQKVWVAGQQLKISRVDEGQVPAARDRPAGDRPRSFARQKGKRPEKRPGKFSGKRPARS